MGDNTKNNTDKEYTVEEVAKHNSRENSVWIIISDEVFDVTKFIDKHPGGPDPLMMFAGKDGTKGFVGNHSKDAEILKDEHKIGIIKKQIDKKDDKKDDKKV